MKMIIIFFFQAEDGIRDPLVTGVQTCALPILRGRPDRVRARTRLRAGWDRVYGRGAVEDPARAGRQGEDRSPGRGAAGAAAAAGRACCGTRAGAVRGGSPRSGTRPRGRARRADAGAASAFEAASAARAGLRRVRVDARPRRLAAPAALRLATAAARLRGVLRRGGAGEGA